MLHSKFSTSFDPKERSVTINIEHQVNGERNFFSPTFYFDEKDKLRILGQRKETFKYLARHIKSKNKDFKQYLEDSFLRERSYEKLPF